MPDERSHPLLQQTALSVNPFIDLPKPPTLPPNYTSLPFSTLPPTILNTAPTNPSSSNSSDLPPYVSTATGTFSAHPSTIIAQNRSLLDQIQREGVDGKKKVEAWEREIEERELRERRRVAPGYLDRDEKILEPVRKGTGAKGEQRNLMDEDGEEEDAGGKLAGQQQLGGREVDDLGEAMDRAFGRSEMG